MPLSADYIWRGFLGSPPPPPPGPARPRRSPRPGQAVAPVFQALTPSPRPGRSRPAAWAAAAASPARPTPGRPSPRPGPALGRGGVGSGGGWGPGRWGGAGARLCGGSGPWRPGAAPSAPRSRQKRLLYAPCPSLGSDLSKGGIFFWKYPPTHGEGFEAGLQSRRRLGALHPAHASREPWKAQPRGAPCTPRGDSGGESPPFSCKAPLPRARGPWQVGAQAPGTEGGARWLPGGWVATRAGREVAVGRGGGERAALPGPGARRLPGREATAAADPEAAGLGSLPPSPLPGSREGRVRRGGGMGARQPPTSLMPGLGN